MILKRNMADDYVNMLTDLYLYLAKKEKIFDSNERFLDLKMMDENAEEEASILLVKLRDSLFKNLHGNIDDFLKEHDGALSEKQIQLVSSWKHAVYDYFYVERHLHNCSVLISFREKKVYTVAGINNDFCDFFHPETLPRFTRTILLPCGEQISFDGFLENRNISFGRNIQRELKEIFLNAKQSNTIISNLLVQPDFSVQSNNVEVEVLSQPYKAEIAQIMELAKKLRGGKDQPDINSAAFSLLRASAEFVQVVSNSLDDEKALQKAYDKLERAMNSVYKKSGYYF